MGYPADDIPEIPCGTEIQNYRIVGRLEIDAGLSRSYLAEHRSYAAPEQLSGKPLSVQTDIYALGVILYELLSGQRPHEVDSFPALVRARIFNAPRDIRSLRPELPVYVADTVMRLIAREPDDRPPTAAAVRTLLEDPRFDAE